MRFWTTVVLQIALCGAFLCDAQTLNGIDVSNYQGSIDWNAVAKSGVSFGMTKVCSREKSVFALCFRQFSSDYSNAHVNNRRPRVSTISIRRWPPIGPACRYRNFRADCTPLVTTYTNY